MAQSHWLNKEIMKHQEQCKRNLVRAMNSLPVTQCIKWPRQAPGLAALGLFFSLCDLSVFKHHSPCHAMWNSQSQGFLLAFKIYYSHSGVVSYSKKSKATSPYLLTILMVCAKCAAEITSLQSWNTAVTAHPTLYKCSCSGHPRHQESYS